MSEVTTDEHKIKSHTTKIVAVGNVGCKVVSNISKMAQTDFTREDLILVNSNFRYKCSTEATYISIDKLKHKNITNIFYEADVVIIVAGMGGSTGTKYAIEVAKKAKESGALTLAVVTKPFNFEGIIRSEVAEIGILKLLKKVDALFIERNNTITSSITCTGDINENFQFSKANLLLTAFNLANIFKPSALITIDIEDIRNIMTDVGIAWISSGFESKEDWFSDTARQALSRAMSNLPLYFYDTKNIIFKIVAGDNLNLYEVNKIVETLKQSFPKDVNIIIGASKEIEMKDKAAITLIGTG
ncbi:MAG: hypothetical protein WC877_04815 [Dehalococcoidales bacterium]|jgi:cell division protein FtsZ